MSARAIAVDQTWCDDVQAVNDALTILALPTSAANQNMLRPFAESACQLISNFLDRLTPFGAPGVAPAPLRTAHAQVTCELYRRKDAPFGVLNAWSQDEVAVRIGNDALAGVKPSILPYKERWGLA